MDEQRRRMAGKFVPLPDPVIQRLKKCHDSCYRVYLSLLNDFHVEEDWQGEGEWVIGTVTVTKAALVEKSQISINRFYRRAWPDLQKAGLVVDKQDGTVILPVLKRKLDESISVAEIKDLKDMESRIERIDEAVEAMWGVLNYISDRVRDTGKMPVLAEIVDNPHTETGKMPVNTGKMPVITGKMPVPILLKEKDQDLSLSGSKVISGFYRGIGQKKISKQKRERADGILKKLRQDGFSLEDIALAVKWTLENAKEEPYDFSIIQHTIGQAIAARKKEEAEAKEIEGRERAAAEEREKREREETERESIEAHKESLAPEERAALREEAEKELKESGAKKEFMSEILIEIKENEILQRQRAEQSDEIEQEEV